MHPWNIITVFQSVNNSRKLVGSCDLRFRNFTNEITTKTNKMQSLK